MSQPFPAWATTALRATLIGVPAVLLLGSAAWGLAYRAPYYTDVGEHVEQPVPFSHQHHVAGLGIDCRYCHAAVEHSASAGMPSSHTCMRCHSQIWSQSAMLAKVRASYREGKPLRWARVNDLPDFVYFHHGIHVASGIACATCHGRVDRMPLMTKAHSLHMRWCLDCHRNPAPFQRARADVFRMDQPTAAPAPRRLLDRNIMDCSTCHR